MPNLLFLDLETTGLDTSTCEVIECAYLYGSHFQSTLFSPTSTIPPEVSGVTNIDNMDVEGCPVFAMSNTLQHLRALANEGYIAVTHNTDFDLAVLEHYGISFKQSICTHKLAWKLLPDLANHKLGTLRAYFGIPHSGEAHRADYDVKILQAVFQKFAEYNTPQQLVELSNQAKAEYLSTWQFGKFKGQKIDPVSHRDYIQWNLMSNANLAESLKKRLKNLINLQ